MTALAINVIAGHTTVAMEDPSDVEQVEELARLLHSKIFPVFAEPSRIAETIDVVFKPQPKPALPEPAREAPRAAAPRSAEASRREERARTDEDVTLESAEGAPAVASPAGEEIVPEEPIVHLMRSMLQDAVLQGASEIHLETRRDGFTVRFRVDGALFERTTVPKSWARPMIAQFKEFAKLDPERTREPQYGAAQFRYKGERIGAQVSTIPTLHGESLVMQIQKRGFELRSLENLELSSTQLERLERLITGQGGLVLATGQNACGKTTTLYAILQRFLGRNKKLVTLENPPERELDGVMQIHADPKNGLSFAEGLRAVLRQDPDVVLVGTLPDAETAELALGAASAGRLMLSTLVAPGATEAIVRLLDLGVAPKLVADALRGVVAQRLLRRVCSGCKQLVTPDEGLLARLGVTADGLRFFEGSGCDKCHGSGYKGRVAVFEVVQVTARLRRLVEERANAETLRAAAVEEGLLTLREDGNRKARSGLTTLHEVLSATAHG